VIQADITKGTMLGSCFDLAYSFATFEHIHDLEQGWQAMLNVLRPGGMLWSVASPLWCSPFGHHKPMFNQYPWVHLEYPTPQDLLSFCEQNAIEAEDGIAMIHHINYMFNPDCFNMLPASAYLQAAANLKGARLDINEVQLLGESGLSDKLIQLMKLGHQRTDLLGQTHMLVARRI
jgi:SAM-dependent methyltransferase